MSTSYSTEEALKELADKLHKEAYALEEAAEMLKTLRDAKNHNLTATKPRWRRS